jgi:hypothetical protein
MKPGYHVTFSTILSGILFMMTKSWSITAACFISGILIDLDHVLDFFILYGWRSFTIKRFFHVFYHVQFKQIYLFFHAWEWLLLLYLAAWITGWNPWFIGMFVGAGHHIILDYISNGGYLWSYSILLRWRNNFDFETTFPGLIKYREKQGTND